MGLGRLRILKQIPFKLGLGLKMLYLRQRPIFATVQSPLSNIKNPLLAASIVPKYCPDPKLLNLGLNWELEHQI